MAESDVCFAVVLRVMVEAPEDAVCRECVAQVAEIIRAQGHAV